MPLSTCAVLIDTQQSGTYIVSPGASGSAISPTVFETTDGGASWHSLAPPAGYIAVPDGKATTLVAGHLITELTPTSGSDYWLGELTPTGTWRHVDTTLPFHILSNSSPAVTQLPASFSVDPEDPAHIYAAMPTGPQGVSLFVTRDAGTSWKQLYHWPTSTLVTVWTAPGNRVYVQDLTDNGVADQFFYSADGGTTWTGAGLHEQGADQIFIGPDGRVITLSHNEIFSLASATGVFTRLAAAPTFSQIPMCAMSSGAQAVLVCGDLLNTYAMPLPATP